MSARLRSVSRKPESNNQMELLEVMSYLESKGSEQTRKIFINHGAPSDGFFGVKVGDLKPIEKKEKNNHQLALDLFATGNSDAQYLAGLIADPSKLTEEKITEWAQNAQWYMVSEYAVAWNLAETPFCVELCDRWINGADDRLKEVAWAALSSYLGIVPNEDLDIEYHRKLIDKVKGEILSAGNRVKYCMNG